MNRRTIVKGALSGVLGLTLPPFARSGFSQESPAVVPVSEGFVMLTGAGGNVLVRTASAGQVLVDGGTEWVEARRRQVESPHVTGGIVVGAHGVAEGDVERKGHSEPR